MGEQSLSPNQNGLNGKNDDVEMNEDIESEEEEEEEEISAEGKLLIYRFGAMFPIKKG